MAKEIERKYLVKNQEYRKIAQSKVTVRQSYLSSNPDATVRIRTIGEKAFITIKSRNHGAMRHEWEYEVPFDDAIEMMHVCSTSRLSRKSVIEWDDGK